MNRPFPEYNNYCSALNAYLGKAVKPDAPIRFGYFEVDLPARRLLRKGRLVPLQDLPFRLLVLLIERSGEILTRDELKARLWSEASYGEFDAGINTAVRKLRKALDDSAENPRFIETLPRIGYRFVAPVAPPASDESPDAVDAGSASAGPVSGFLTQTTPVVQQGRHKLWLGALVVIPAALFSLSLRNREAPEPPDATPQMSPLTSYPGVESSPSFSPGGTQVAFAWNGGHAGPSDIYVKVVGQGESLRVTSSLAADTAPAWSPDGRWIAFIRIHTLGEPGSVYLISPLGGQEQKVAGQAETVSWMPDSKSLLVVTPFNHRSNSAIEELHLDTEKRRRITNPEELFTLDRYGVSSPDGTTLAFARCRKRDQCDIFAVPMAGGPGRKLTEDAAPISGLAWSADGNEIVFSSLRSGEPRLWRVQTSGRGGKPQPVLPAERRLTAPAISRAAAGVPPRLAYEQTLGSTRIWRTEILRSGRGRKLGRTEPLLASSQSENEPSYSPDGSQIAFMSNRSGPWHAWVADSEGKKVYPLAGLAGDLNWSPNGLWLASNCAEDPAKDEEDICVAATSGGPVRRLIESPDVETIPFWSRDGKSLYFVSNRSGDLAIWKTSANGGQATQVTANGTLGGWDSPDGKHLFYFKNMGPPGVFAAKTLWRTPLHGGLETSILEAAYPMFISVSQDGIYFLNPARLPGQGPDVLKLYRWNTREAVTIGKLAAPVQRSPTALSVSPNGRYVLTVHFEVNGGDLKIVENFR